MDWVMSVDISGFARFSGLCFYHPKLEISNSLLFTYLSANVRMYIVCANNEANDGVHEKENEREKEQQMERNKWKQVAQQKCLHNKRNFVAHKGADECEGQTITLSGSARQNKINSTPYLTANYTECPVETLE